jgi:hypothetical protein
LIQVSDVCHAKLHWHIYIKWNELFFHECYEAYKDGRVETDPSIDQLVQRRNLILRLLHHPVGQEVG